MTRFQPAYSGESSRSCATAVAKASRKRSTSSAVLSLPTVILTTQNASRSGRPMARSTGEALCPPEEQADPLLLLNSEAARFVSGHALMVDAGFVGGVLTGQIDVQSRLAAVR